MKAFTEYICEDERIEEERRRDVRETRERPVRRRSAKEIEKIIRESGTMKRWSK